MHALRICQTRRFREVVIKMEWIDYDKDNPPALGWYVVIIEYDWKKYYRGDINPWMKVRYFAIAIGRRYKWSGGKLDGEIDWEIETYEIDELGVDYEIKKYVAIENAPPEVTRQYDE